MKAETRVKYNFIMKLPKASKFTMAELQEANPGVSYITLYMRLKKGFKQVGVRPTGGRGCPPKVFRRSSKKA